MLFLAIYLKLRLCSVYADFLPKRIDLVLDRIKRLLAVLGHPEESYFSDEVINFPGALASLLFNIDVPAGEFTYWGKVSGPQQWNPRSEVFAVITTPPIEVLAHCSYLSLWYKGFRCGEWGMEMESVKSFCLDPTFDHLLELLESASERNNGCSDRRLIYSLVRVLRSDKREDILRYIRNNAAESLRTRGFVNAGVYYEHGHGINNLVQRGYRNIVGY